MNTYKPTKKTRYGYKFPAWNWDRVVYLKKAKTAQQATQMIDAMFQYVSEPFVQLVEDDGETLTVIAEYLPSRRRWMSPLKAAGLERC